MDLQTVTSFMMQHFEQCTVSNSGTHFLARCLLCGDSKKSKYKKRFKLYSKVKGLSIEDAKSELFKYNKKEIKRKCEEYKIRPKKEEKKEVEENNFNWVKSNCYDISLLKKEKLGILEKKYLEELNNFYIERKIPYTYKLYICHTGKYKNRIIIPIFNENKDIIYFQARRILNSKIEPKYNNPRSPKELCILNKDKFNPDKNIIIFEGLIDAFMCGDQATSCLGKEIKDKLIEELFKLTNKDIIIALDNDKEAYRSLYKFINENKFARKVKYFIYPSYFKGYNDINKYIRESKKDLDVYKLITQESVNYLTAYTKIKSIYKMFLREKKGNENNNTRK